MGRTQEFGLNQATLSSFCVMIFGIIGAYGQWKQARLIWSSRSARSVSILWILTFLFMFLAYFLQGLNTGSATLLIQGMLRAAFCLPILVGIIAFEYSKISRKDVLFFVILVTGMVIMVLVPDWRNLFFQLFGYLGVIMSIDQPYQIWKNKSRGKVSMTMLITFISAVSFWTWYAWIFEDMGLFWLSLSFVLVYLVTIVIWWIYSKDQKVNT